MRVVLVLFSNYSDYKNKKNLLQIFTDAVDFFFSNRRKYNSHLLKRGHSKDIENVSKY